jgi:uncharacterized protein (TIGR02996 family)
MAKRSRTAGKARPEAEALLHAVKASPDDDTPRLIMADWLEEHGDGPRAEFIRLQIELTLPGVSSQRQWHLRQRESDLLREHFLTWAAPVDGLVRNARFRRGFVEQVTVTFADLIHQGDRVFDAAPVSHLVIVGAWPSRGDPLACPHLARVRTLDFRDNIINADAAALLGHCEYLHDLGGLVLRLNPLTDAGLAALAGCRNMPRLETLDLQCTSLNDGTGVEALANSPLCANLTRLVLGGNQLGEGAVLPLTRSPHLGRLRTLHLAWAELTDSDADALATADTFPSLRHLDLSHNRFRAKGARALAASPHLRSLEVLRLTGQGLSKKVREELQQQCGSLVLN